jgi:CheY-like chemotaxis protein
VIEVADSGPGVPLEDRDRIFEPFITTKGIGEGVGLGLFVCRNIVRGFSGTMTVGERPGGGALFRVELPAAPAGESHDAQPTPTKPAMNEAPRGHVLIIDDEVLVANSLSAELSSAGYRASVEQDPIRALETLASAGHDIDLVYCDLMMKTMSGMDLAEALLARSPAHLQKFVFMTGGAYTPRARAFRKRYTEQCVDKPFNILEETSRRIKRN